MSSFSLVPYAWSYELANVMNPDGSYGHWSQPLLSFTEPNVPEGSIRNLTPLYTWPATSSPAREALAEYTVPWPAVTRYSGGASADGVAGRVWIKLGDGPEETEYVRADRDPKSEFVQQIVYALERQVAALDAQAEKLGDQLNYGAEFFAEDANRLREVIALLKSEAGSGTREALAAKCKELADRALQFRGMASQMATPAAYGPADKARVALRAAIDELAALTEQPAAPPVDPVSLAAEPAAQPVFSLHPKTDDLVNRFAVALKQKLAAAELKYGHSDGWSRADWMDECRRCLVEHVAKGDPRDVAAYCAFLWHHGERTAIAQTETPPGAAPHNPWREFIENVINGDNYFKSQEYCNLLEYIDSLLVENANAKAHKCPTAFELWIAEQPGNPPPAECFPDECRTPAECSSLGCRVDRGGGIPDASLGASDAEPEARPDQQSDSSAAPQGVQAEPLTDEQRLHLGQAADLLDEYGNECSRCGGGRLCAGPAEPGQSMASQPSEAVAELVDALDPDTLGAIADEIDYHEHSARAGSLRVLAKRHRAALAKHGQPKVDRLRCDRSCIVTGACSGNCVNPLAGQQQGGSNG